jgi:hypothetical protein
MEIGLVRARIKDIESFANDPEKAHSLEDDLYIDVLMHLASKGCKLSHEALMSRRIDFPRWTA